MNASTSIMQIVDGLVERAIALGSSDVHLETQADRLRVRYRIDGFLYDQEPLSSSIAAQITSRLKIISQMDIAEKRIPQDGKFRFNVHGKEIDLRVSTFPSILGEKLVIRILDHHTAMLDLEKLGMKDSLCARITNLLEKQNGFFLVTGPTGSGKTTTLYAALSKLNKQEKNIITLEDPIEYHIKGITQGQVNTVAGFTFARGVRSMLRQDPDVVMIGEIRDQETARSAVEAALTGHLVLSTVHTSDAPSVVMRLMDMAVEPFLINAVLTGVLAQRLVRVLCSACRYSKRVDDHDKKLLERIQIDADNLYVSKGCAACFNLGYKGRVGLFEFLTLTDQLRNLIIQQPSIEAISTQAKKDGMITLLDDACNKMQRGIISLQELARVLL